MTRARIHARGNPRTETRVSGANRLNDKSVKVLAAIKFSPTSISREDIAEKTSLPVTDVERQVGLLIQLHLIQKNTKFPQYPAQGWRVYTSQEDHTRIIDLLRQHGFEDPRVAPTRQLLGDYYPTGLDLEGNGIQEDRHMSYVKGHPIIPELKFRPEANEIMKKFRDEKQPFRPKEFSPQAVEDKKQKWIWFVKEMSRAYHITAPTVTFGTFSQDSWYRNGSSADDDNHQSSYFNRATNTLFFTGKFSLTTLLHEFGHARGFDERDTIIWSINFGTRIFPVTFNRLLVNSEEGTHMLTRGNETEARFNL